MNIRCVKRAGPESCCRKAMCSVLNIVPIYYNINCSKISKTLKVIDSVCLQCLACMSHSQKQLIHDVGGTIVLQKPLRELIIIPKNSDSSPTTTQRLLPRKDVSQRRWRIDLSDIREEYCELETSISYLSPPIEGL